MRYSCRNYSGWLLVGGLVSSLAGCSHQSQVDPPQAEKQYQVRAMAVQAGSNLQEIIEISGPVGPVRGTDLAAQAAGAVVEIAKDKGATVSVGEVILMQERTILAAEFEAARADLVPLSFNLEKMNKLFAAGKISELELLQTQNSFAQGNARVKASAKRYARATVMAPFSGVVVDRFVELGQYLLPAQKAVRLIDPFTLKLAGYATDKEVGRVTVGQSCQVMLGTSSKPATGTVSFVSCEADLMTGKFKIEVEIPNPNLEYRSGVIGRARLPLAGTVKVAIPRDAILTDLIGSSIFLVRGNRALRRAITVGSDQGMMVAVLAGLDLGDTLIVRGQRDLKEGSRVQISEWSQAPDGSLPADPATVRGVSADEERKQP